MIQGTLNYKEIEFEFILDKENLQLRPKEKFEKKFVECFRQDLGNGAYTYKNNYLEDEYLIGQRLENYQYIIFIPESKNINTYFFTDFLYIKVKHVLYMNRLVPIDKLYIYCKELNAIYDIRQSIEKRGFNQNGEAELRLKSYEQNEGEEFEFKYKDKKVKCCFNISKTLHGKITEFPVQIRSQISLKFEATNDYMIISDLYDIVRKSIQYLCYRENVTMEEIKIYSKDEKNVYRQVGTFETRCEEIITEEDRILENRYISYDYIKDIIGNIFQSISNQDLYMRHFPLTYKDGKKENESTFIMTTAAFEWEFKKLYPKGIERSETTKEAQEEITEKINELKDNSTGKKKKIYKNLLKFIDLEGFSENLVYTCNDLNDIIFPFGDKLYKINNEHLDYKEMGERLSEQRNHFAHGDIDQEFIGLALLDLIFLKEIVYAMQLKRFGATDIEIKKSLNDLFNAGLQV